MTLFSRAFAGLLSLILVSSVVAAQTDTLSLSVAGTVTDASTGRPIPYATVSCPTCHNGGTLTNEAGAFELFPKTDAATVELTVSHILYTELVRQSPPAAEPLRLILEPARIDLPTVEVNGRKAQALLLAACAKLRRETRNSFRGKAFYRQQTMTDGSYNALLESFVEIGLNSQGVQRWETITGRYGFSPQDGWMRMSNFSMFSRKISTFKDEYSEGHVVYPLNAGTHKWYAIAVEKYLTAGGRTLAVVRCTPEPNAPKEAYTGTIYVDTVTMDIPEFHMSGVDGAGVSIAKDKGTVGPVTHELTARLRRSADGTAQLFTSISNSISCDFTMKVVDKEQSTVISSTFLVLEAEPVRRIKKGNEEDPNDYDRIMSASYKPRFWRKFAVLKNTPLEEQLIADFEAKGYFGTVKFD